jgi:tellurite methyltransferase
MNKKPFWEECYNKDGPIKTFEGGKPSSEFFELIKKLHLGANVLDLGCGDGRNSIFLGENGFEITAIDISETGIRKLKQQALEKGLKIKAEVQDMRNFTFKRTYDLIIAHGCLHLIERDYWIPLIGEIKDHTKQGGFNVIAVFTDKLPPPDHLKDFTIGLFREGELFDFYEDWNIIYQKSYILKDKHPGIRTHKHPINKIVAQKIN